jgi:hypothetical protein
MAPKRKLCEEDIESELICDTDSDEYVDTESDGDVDQDDDETPSAPPALPLQKDTTKWGLQTKNPRHMFIRLRAITEARSRVKHHT